MPSSNILLLGSQKRGLAGFSTTTVVPHTGLIYYSALVQDLPKVCCELVGTSALIIMGIATDSSHLMEIAYRIDGL